MRKYNCIVWKEDGIWTAHSPSVPGSYGTGRTRQSAIADLTSALRDVVAYLKDIGGQVPRSLNVSIDTVEA